MAKQQAQGAKGQSAETRGFFNYVANLTEAGTDQIDTTSTGGKSASTGGNIVTPDIPTGKVCENLEGGSDLLPERPVPMDAALQAILASQSVQTQAMQRIGAALAIISNSVAISEKGRDQPMCSERPQDGGAQGDEGEVSEDDAMESLVNQCIDSDHNISNTNQEEDINDLDSVMQDMKDFFGQSDETGPPIQVDLARTVSEGLATVPNKDKLKSLMEQYKRPKNIENLLAPRVNAPIWNEARSLTRRRDIRLQNVQGVLATGIIPVVQIMESLMIAVKNCQQVDPIDLLTKSKDAVRLLIGVHSDLSMKRRENFKPDLREPYKQLCSQDINTTTNLFGDELPKNIKDITEAKELSSKLHSSGKNFNKGPYYNNQPAQNSHGYGNNSFRFKPYDSTHKGQKRGGFAKGRGFQAGSTDRRMPHQHNQRPFLGRSPTGPKTGPRRN